MAVAAAVQWTAARGMQMAQVSRTSREVGIESGGSGSRRNLMQGMGVGVAAAASMSLEFLKARSGRRTDARTSVGCSGAGGQEVFAVGDYCPLYSDRESVSVSPSPVMSGRIARSRQNWEARSVATSVDGISVDTVNSLSAEQVLPRVGKVSRVTKETSVDVHLNLDGTGICSCDTGIPFLDHMLDQLASHGLLDVKVVAKGDIHIDDHHTNEDIGLAVGTALLQALGDRKGINRFGDFSAPLDEALVHVVLDLSGRPFLGYDVHIPTERVGTYDTQLVEHFFQSVVNTSGMTLHIRQLAGKNSHHIIEATFKAFARALRQAMEYDVRRKGTIPSSKGVLSRA